MWNWKYFAYNNKIKVDEKYCFRAFVISDGEVEAGSL